MSTCHFFGNFFHSNFFTNVFINHISRFFFDSLLFIMKKSPKNGRKVKIRPKIGSFSRCQRTIISVIFFQIFFSANVFLEIILQAVFRIITFHYVKISENGPKVTLRQKITSKFIYDF